MSKPLTITATPKTSIFDTVKRAMNNADVNDKIVTLSFASSTTLVYPHDNQKTLIHHLKTLQLQEQISFLRKA